MTKKEYHARAAAIVAELAIVCAVPRAVLQFVLLRADARRAGGLRNKMVLAHSAKSWVVSSANFLTYVHGGVRSTPNELKKLGSAVARLGASRPFMTAAQATAIGDNATCRDRIVDSTIDDQWGNCAAAARAIAIKFIADEDLRLITDIDCASLLQLDQPASGAAFELLGRTQGA